MRRRAKILAVVIIMITAVIAQGQRIDVSLKQIISNKTHISNIEYKINSSHVSRTSGARHIYFTQTLNNRPIVNTRSAIHISQKGEVLKFTDHFIELTTLKKGNTNRLQKEKKELFLSVLKQLNIEEPKQYKIQKSNSLSFQIFAPSITKSNISAELQWYKKSDTELIEVWKMIIQESNNSNWWEVICDAQSGKIIDENNYTVTCDWDADLSRNKSNLRDIRIAPNQKNHEKSGNNGSYHVFAFPLESPHQGSSSIETDPSNSLASPKGWHDINGQSGADIYYTRGNNVWANEDLNGNNGRGHSPRGGSSLLFHSSIDLLEEPIEYLDGAITNLFYWNNIIHDIIYQYGFTEDAGNFQDNNYSKGGLEKDFVVADAQDFGNCNANFSTPPDGVSATMQMYTCANTSPQRDSDLDNGVIIHEYAHGISNRLVGGGANTGCLNNEEQMGEGWSDFYAIMLTMLPTDTINNPARPMGNYFTGRPINGPGIRPYPYSPDTTINPLTYGDIPSLTAPHAVGSLWATMLWDLNWALIDAYGYDSDIYHGIGGNNLALRLVTEGLKLTDCNPGFTSGRDAILLADTLLYDGANSCIIWETFANRGLGINADQGDTDNSDDGAENFDTPICAQQDSFLVSAPIRIKSGCDQTSFTINIIPYNKYSKTVTLSLSGLTSGVVGTFGQNSIAGGGSTTLTLTNTSAQNSIFDSISVIGTSIDTDHSIDLIWEKPPTPAVPILMSPSNNSTIYSARPKMTWQPINNATGYEIQIATDQAFNNILSADADLLSNEYYPELIDANQLIYWKVRSLNPCDSSQFSTVQSFEISSCGAVFTDEGGISSDHDDAERITYTICPDEILDNIAIDFSSFDLEEVNSTRCWDWLVVYDGIDVSEEPIGEYCNEGLSFAPGEGYIKSSHATGCLTFEFFSDPFVAEAGWIGDIICIPADLDISGPEILCQSMNSVAYQITLVTEATNYLWSYSGTDVSINTNGLNMTNLNFGPDATSGQLSCTLTLPRGEYIYQIGIDVSDNEDCLDNYCSNNNLVITDTILSAASNPDIFHSLDSLTSDGKVNNSKKIVFKSEQTISATSGFEVSLGASVEMLIENCPN